MTNPCAPVISVFLRPVSTRRRRWTHKEHLTDKLEFISVYNNLPLSPINRSLKYKHSTNQNVISWVFKQ